jgi:HAD superfamily hydrolase (TIGR01509 family)
MKHIKNKIKAVIFDMDGTIISTEHLWEQVLSDFLKIHGIDKSDQSNETFFRKIASKGLKYSTQKIIEKFNISGTLDENITKQVELFQILAQEKNATFINGFQNFHKQLQNHRISTSLATNANLATLTFLDNKINLENFFGKNMYCLEHVDYKAKPDPTLFLHAAKKLNVKPQECVVFEDSYAGFQAARCAEIKCIAVKNEYNKDILHLADGAIENYDQAVEEIKKILL